MHQRRMRRATMLAITLGLLFTVLLTAGRELYPDTSRRGEGRAYGGLLP